ncbi:MAG: serine hydrolase domain-containing protein [Candidatus Hodarchaeota archaeon]
MTDFTPSTVEYWPTTDWLSSTPEEQGMNSTKLNQMAEYIASHGFAIDSVVIVRNGYIVHEEYPNPTTSNRDHLHFLYSVTKSFSSALIGIAIQKGYISCIDQKVVEFFPNRTIANLDARKQNMTLEHLLTMTTGLEWDEWTYPYTDSRNDVIRMINSGDAVQFVLDRPMKDNPGTMWVYSTGASHLLSAIIEQRTGKTTLEFANEFLFKPLGIEKVYWGQDPQGVYYGGFDLYLRARDMAKFGYLYLNNGTWDNQQIVAADWVSNSSETSFYFSKDRGYSYQWWTYPKLGIYYASGLYAQSIFVVPDSNLVVVFTANIRSGSNPEHRLLFEYIIPAIMNGSINTSLPPNFDILLPFLPIVLVVPIIAIVIYLLKRRG